MESAPSPEPIIGVLGGMGPHAGIDLVKKIFEETNATSDQGHLPVALLSYPRHIQDRTEYMLHGGPHNPAIEIARIAVELEKTGANVAGIPCNSAHAPPIFDSLQDQLKEKKSGLQLLHMISATVTHIKTAFSGFQHIGILSTNSIYKLGVYATPLSEAGFTPLVLPFVDHDRLVHQAVYSTEHGIKPKGNPITKKAREDLLEAISRLTSMGAEAIILGCTEIPMAIPESNVHGVPTIDPTRILARALITHTYPEKLKPLDTHQ